MLYRVVITGIVIAASINFALAKSGDDNAFEEFAARWQAAYKAGDMSALEALYEPDAKLMTRHQSAKVGRQAILDYFAEVQSGGGEASIDIEPEEIVVDGDYAFETSKWFLTFSPGDGGANFHDAGRSFIVFKRGDDGAWRIWRDIDNHTPDAPVKNNQDKN